MKVLIYGNEVRFKRVKRHPRWGSRHWVTGCGKVLKQLFYNGKELRCFPISSWVDNGTGYERVNITVSFKVRKNVAVHSLVAETYLGPRPEGKEVDHIDNDKLNNDWRNLQYLTKSENHLKRWRHKKGPGWVSPDRSNKTGRTRLKLEDAREIRASGLPVDELADRYGKHKHTIRRILWGKVLPEKTGS